MDRLLEVWRLWDAVARERRPDAVYVGTLGGGIRVVKDLARIGQVAGWFNADHQGRSGDTPLWDCAQQGRVARSVMNGRTITRSEEHTSELQSQSNLVCRLLLEKKK